MVGSIPRLRGFRGAWWSLPHEMNVAVGTDSFGSLGTPRGSPRTGDPGETMGCDSRGGNRPRRVCRVVSRRMPRDAPCRSVLDNVVVLPVRRVDLVVLRDHWRRVPQP